jgi:hypothetical protein
VAPFPSVAAGLDALGVDSSGRVCARWESAGLFVYAPSRRSPGLRLIGCWMAEFASAPCGRADAFSSVTYEYIVPAPDAGRVFFNNQNGIAITELR